jgi:salicylate hydroxylase
MQYMAQGAAQATEDAACLASCLAHFDNLPEALQAYQKRRIPRTACIARNTRVLQEWWHVHDGPLKDKRDAAMAKQDSNDNPMFWGSKTRRDWLFGFDARNLDADVQVPSLPPEVDAEDSVYRHVRSRKAR